MTRYRTQRWAWLYLILPCTLSACDGLVGEGAEQVASSSSAEGACGMSDNDTTTELLVEQLCGSVNEGSTVRLACPSGQSIQSIGFASYGTPGGACGSFSTGACNAATSVSVVSSACVGKTSCAVRADNQTFGDPCLGTFKRLYVQASCGSSPVGDAINGPSGGDDRPIIQAAIDRAVLAGDKEVILRGGTYLLNSYDSASGSHLVFNRGNAVSLRGFPGETVTLLMGHLDKHGVTANETRDLTIDNVIIDWGQHPFGQGSVYSVDTANRKVWVTNDSGYLPWNNDHFNEATATIFLARSARDGTPPQCTLTHGSAPAWGYANGRNWFTYQSLNDCPDGIAPGQKVVLVKNSWTSTGLNLVRVKGAVISNVTLYAAPGLAVLNANSEPGTVFPKMSFINYRILFHPTDTSRTITTNSDGIHSTGSRAAFLVKDSLMTGMMDDGMNLHTRTGYFVNRWQSGGQWMVSLHPNGGWGDWRSGDQLDIYNILTKTRLCTVRAEGEPYDCSTVQLYMKCLKVSAPMYGTACTGMNSYNGSNTDTADHVANMNHTIDVSTQTPSIIENNQFLGHRGRAVINRMWNTIIRNNVFGSSTSHSSATGIYEGWCAGEATYMEGALVTPAQNPTQLVTGNTGYFGNAIEGCL